MEDKLNDLLLSLDGEIDRKCREIKKERQEKKNLRLFAFICTLFVCVPIALLFAGINILLIVVPAVCFFAINLFILAPLVINNDMGGAVQ